MTSSADGRRVTRQPDPLRTDWAASYHRNVPRLRLQNQSRETLCVFVEPVVYFWIVPSQSLVFTAAGSEPEVDCIWHEQGVSVWMGAADAYGFVVTTEAGDVVESGYQRPSNAFGSARSSEAAE